MIVDSGYHSLKNTKIPWNFLDVRKTQNTRHFWEPIKIENFTIFQLLFPSTKQTREKQS